MAFIPNICFLSFFAFSCCCWVCFIDMSFPFSISFKHLLLRIGSSGCLDWTSFKHVQTILLYRLVRWQKLLVPFFSLLLKGLAMAGGLFSWFCSTLVYSLRLNALHFPSLLYSTWFFSTALYSLLLSSSLLISTPISSSTLLYPPLLWTLFYSSLWTFLHAALRLYDSLLAPTLCLFISHSSALCIYSSLLPPSHWFTHSHSLSFPLAKTSTIHTNPHSLSNWENTLDRVFVFLIWLISVLNCGRWKPIGKQDTGEKKSRFSP